jgi:hypothetical protein
VLAKAAVSLLEVPEVSEVTALPAQRLVLRSSLGPQCVGGFLLLYGLEACRQDVWRLC